MTNNCATLITAAGNSGRMGSNKALLKFDEELSFLEKIIDTYTAFACKEIVITVNYELFQCIENNINPKIKLVINAHPEWERMHSIQLGLQAIRNCDYCFIQSIDNPFANLQLINQLYKHKSSDAFIVPTYKNQGGHPILINKTIINYFCEKDLKKQKLNEVLKQFERINIDVDDESILYNINTIEEFRQIILKHNIH